MTDPTPTRRWYRLTLDRFLIRLLVVACFFCPIVATPGCRKPPEQESNQPKQETNQPTWSIDSVPDWSKPGSLPKGLTVEFGNGVKLELVLIPAGEFMMGSPDSDKEKYRNFEGPQHRVRITKPFYRGSIW